MAVMMVEMPSCAHVNICHNSDRLYFLNTHNVRGQMICILEYATHKIHGYDSWACRWLMDGVLFEPLPDQTPMHTYRVECIMI